MIEHIYSDIEGWFSFKEQYDNMINVLPNGATVVEVGCWQGRSLSYMIIENLNKNKKFKIFAVDSYNNTYDGYYGTRLAKNPNFLKEAKENFFNNLKDYRNQFTFIESISWKAAEQFKDESIDYVMIDAGHSYEDVIRDLESFYPKIKMGGYIGGDDYGRDGNNGVAKAVKEICQKYKQEFELVNAKNPVTGQRSSKCDNFLIKKV